MDNFIIDTSVFRDIGDVLIVAFLIYRGLLLIKGTRAFAMLFGLVGIGGLYFLSSQFGLLTLSWLLGSVLNSFILLVVVIFQEEIRRALTKFGLHPFIRKTPAAGLEEVIKSISLAATKLAKARLGALIVIQRDVGLDNIVEQSIELDAILHRKLLYSIFLRDSPLHDGAVLIVGDRIRAVGCVLPLSHNPDLDPNLGTRHRAALGLSELCDSIVIVVSEETSAISIAKEGTLLRNLDIETLGAQLYELLSEATPYSGQSRRATG